MNVDDIVAERIAAARRKAENNKRRRRELAEARRHGLPRRHAQKLRNLARHPGGVAQELNNPVPPPPDAA
ncbi:hypothetical protein ACFUJR_20780 [Streptomyces sp. NPDC057271]|uniref:hypothetical protein n=1 Tax=unclassified Streptomyces TaxID=2593676 RepID=UPI00362778B3